MDVSADGGVLKTAAAGHRPLLAKWATTTFRPSAGTVLLPCLLRWGWRLWWLGVLLFLVLTAVLLLWQAADGGFRDRSYQPW